MSDSNSFNDNNLQEIFSKSLRAGRRTYFFDVRETKAGDYYLTITESKKTTHENGDASYRKHKIYLYKEDFENFKENLDEITKFITDAKGDEVISEKHQKDYNFPHQQEDNTEENVSSTQESIDKKEDSLSDFTDVDFDDI